MASNTLEVYDEGLGADLRTSPSGSRRSSRFPANELVNENSEMRSRRCSSITVSANIVAPTPPRRNTRQSQVPELQENLTLSSAIIGLNTDMVVRTSDTTLSAPAVTDKLYGCILGHILGDRIGQAVKGEQTARWSCATDEMLVLLASAIERKGALNPTAFAQSLLAYQEKGLTELGDQAGPQNIGATAKAAMSQACFVLDPHKAAQIVANSRGFVPDEESVQRCTITGVVCFQHTETVASNAIRISKVTHNHPPSVAAGLAVASVIACILRSPEVALTNCEVVVNDALEVISQFFGADRARFNDFRKVLVGEDTAQCESLPCAAEHAAGAAFAALIKQGVGAADFAKSVEEVAKSSQYPVATGAIYGALLGCALGESRLPRQLRETIPHKEWIEGKIAELVDLMEI
eukprot:Colp12_sorted_trinity150504_noHs@3015